MMLRNWLGSTAIRGTAVCSTPSPSRPFGATWSWPCRTDAGKRWTTSTRLDEQRLRLSLAPWLKLKCPPSRARQSKSAVMAGTGGGASRSRPICVVCPALRARLGRAATAEAPAAGATGRAVVEAEVVFSTSRRSSDFQKSVGIFFVCVCVYPVNLQ